MTTIRRIHVGPATCILAAGHDGPCNGFARICKDGRPCWALRSLSTTRKLTSCTLNAGHSGSCNGVSRMVGAGWCWDLAEQRREAMEKYGTEVDKLTLRITDLEVRLKAHTLYVAFVDEIPSLTTEPHEITEEISAPEVVKMWDTLKARVRELEQEGGLLQAAYSQLQLRSSTLGKQALDGVRANAQLQTRITDLEADNTRLRTRVNELLSMTASNH